MKYVSLFVLSALVLAPFFPRQADALSCLSVGEYLKDVVGKETIVIFTATAKDVIETPEHTAEVLRVESVSQGYVEKDIFAYHEKSPDWGYLCNNGPKGKGSQGLYVAERTSSGSYQVHQRLALTDTSVTTLIQDLKNAEIAGEVAELSRADRMQQIMTTIGDLLKQITVLLKEYTYWKGL